ncbi:MAG: class II aldolase/adducin family protein [Rhodospirillaceae bacterium]|nr:class II aldolase/adducin family protein [Rhodospirillaceae bacterium]
MPAAPGRAIASIKKAGTKDSSVRNCVSAAEWNVRTELAAAYRLVAQYGWDDLIFTHMSARVPDAPDQYLLNPLGLLFEEVTASSLVKVAADGAVLLDERGSGINPGGFVIHGAVHAARHDANCVIHLHTVASVAVSCQKGGLLPLQQGAMMIADEVTYHDYEGIALDTEERVRLNANLGQKNYMILRNHGLLTLGGTVGDAFARAYSLNRSCEIQLAAQSGGADLNWPDQAVRDKVRHQVRPQGSTSKNNALAWAALLRRLERTDPGYKD